MIVRSRNAAQHSTGVVVTSVGAVTASGTSVAELMDDLHRGRRRVTTRRIPLVATPVPAALRAEGSTDREVRAAHVSAPLDLAGVVDGRTDRTLGRDSRLLLYATHTTGSGLAPHTDRVGVVVGTLGSGRNEYLAIHNGTGAGPGAVNPVWGPQAAYNAPAAQLSVHLGARGPNLTLSCGVTAGLEALVTGARQLNGSGCEAVVAAGLDTLSAAVPPTSAPGEPPHGEAAAVAVLEPAAKAADRAVARVLGTGQATAALTDSDTEATVGEALAEAAAEAARRALGQAGRHRDEVGVAVTTSGGDTERAAEHAGLGAVFGARLPVCDATWTTGRTGGADGMLAVVVAAEVLARGVVPPPPGGPPPRTPVPAAGPLALCLGVDRGGKATAVLLGGPSPEEDTA
ncbi:MULTISPECIES: beta-ketoacyl synthase N-terminal-like domain-containing protein [unclassified Streptomyces]|uniref:beta-ketoacyl synthase N-terminal-like domain-containing protein n=1 Tax=unclassified Streptomyces TaxID=2593676 RepID=UPI0022B642B5|nr:MULTISPECIES: beta-ketoacyl synthase N-terminal-like domain-containing protein [unclassified Streptomyces]MCZ7416008.1 beta-ketoacyl synthase N-terminal-like domain-containing protein [Streptomyces sp. WMMC897]MCZ7434185.1 beta-ketoacyl synthase N-terminal-like domain-containing protein [Streptomyces sp. WMMC1477]